MNKNIVFLGAVISILLTGGVVIGLKSASSPTTNSNYVQIPTTANTEKVMGKVISISEIANHNNLSDCWMAVDGGVYDVTKYVGSHPGGQVIANGCGVDASEMFRRHSQRASLILKNYKIGEL